MVLYSQQVPYVCMPGVCFRGEGCGFLCILMNGRILDWRNLAFSDRNFRIVYPKVTQKTGIVSGLKNMLPQVQHRFIKLAVGS